MHPYRRRRWGGGRVRRAERRRAGEQLAEQLAEDAGGAEPIPAGVPAGGPPVGAGAVVVGARRGGQAGEGARPGGNALLQHKKCALATINAPDKKRALQKMRQKMGPARKNASYKKFVRPTKKAPC